MRYPVQSARILPWRRGPEANVPSPVTVGPLSSNILKRKFNMRLLSKMFSFQGWDSRLDYLASIGMSVAFLLVGVLLVFGLSKVLAPASMSLMENPP